MTEFIFLIFVAFILAFLLALLINNFAYSKRVFLSPQKYRVNKRPAIEISGAAIPIAFFITLFFGFFLFKVSPAEIFGSMKLFMGYVIGAVVLIIVGVLNDTKRIPSSVKFLFYLLAALCAITSGITIVDISIPFVQSQQIVLYPIVGYAITAAWMLLLILSFKLINNMEKYSSWIFVSVFFTLLVATIYLDSLALQIIVAILLGINLGYLPHNVGHDGSMVGEAAVTFLGYTVSVLSIVGGFKEATTVGVVLPLLVIGFPIIEVIIYAIKKLFKKKLNKVNIDIPTKGCLYYRMVNKNYDEKQTFLCITFIMATAGLSSLILIEKGTKSCISFALSSIIILSILFYLFNKFENKKRMDYFDPIRKNK